MFNPNDFLSLASDLASDDAKEADYRCCVSRCYYSSFLLARELLLLKDMSLNFSDGKAHVRVRIELENKYKLYSVSDMLRRLHEKRKVSDYDLTKTVDYRQSSIAIRLSNEIKEELTNCTDLKLI